MRSLLDRQRAIVDHLRRPKAFRADDNGTVPPDLVLPKPDRLSRLGEHALRKRATSARAAFPKTVALLNDQFLPLFADFANAYPAPGIDRWQNALQFHDYLKETWAKNPPQPSYLQDLLAFETALWRAWRRPKRSIGPESPSAGHEDIVGKFVCADDVILLLLAHDIRPLVERTATSVAPTERPVHLAIRRVRGTVPAKIFEVPAATFAVLRRIQTEPIPCEHLLLEPGMDRTMVKNLISLGILESAL